MDPRIDEKCSVGTEAAEHVKVDKATKRTSTTAAKLLAGTLSNIW